MGYNEYVNLIGKALSQYVEKAVEDAENLTVVVVATDSGFFGFVLYLDKENVGECGVVFQTKPHTMYEPARQEAITVYTDLKKDKESEGA